MDTSAQVRDFLRTRRDRLRPEDVGIVGGQRRRVPGLRREEVAMLAGMSVEYYVKLERGNLRGVSEGVLGALARALRLSQEEHRHLMDLARSANSGTAASSFAPTRHVRPALQQMLDAMSAPAWVRNGRSDFVAANALGRALYSPLFTSSVQPPNTARFVFLDPRGRDYYPQWEVIGQQMVASLRAEAGRHPFDRPLTDLIGELSTRSDEFRRWWGAHEVFTHGAGSKRIHHPDVGDLELNYEPMELTADAGLTMIVYSAEPGSPTADALALLASLHADRPPLERVRDDSARPS
ncbi:helix-turn-helix domain-containing protein [Gordonia pseudamarae]|jgi:transcriptional regulator with XRE-family HTH domain|uniref:Helix-turn-helix domain-containing protein n=1 Tax=Gordonia pseudamarae TaxID=2831662 RepID=A0ABX6IDN0_9ACTN|nr:MULTISPECIES: helix-turn-helix transcriptional regulator [Gordonia]MBD0024215.1 helix-turn-helix domain-containing protein [Gordonia sp. (in: high G+C Gram-positive bacteria)]QHN24607.1 helix-turn-helix domain-containing protein [Gordonia pseudamarae]QHN33538.1 helix-turn-helix domain-containing protein [Gordonia pseudamarae]